MLHEFTRKDNGELFDQLHFVAGAVKKKALRPFKTIIKINGRCAIATDGRRLHHAKLVSQPLENGFYVVVKRTKTMLQLTRGIDLDFYPDVKMLFKQDRKGWNEIELSGDTVSSTAHKIARAGNDDVCYDVKFLEPLEGGHWDVAVPDNMVPLYAKNNNKTAFIMPIKM